MTKLARTPTAESRSLDSLVQRTTKEPSFSEKCRLLRSTWPSSGVTREQAVLYGARFFRLLKHYNADRAMAAYLRDEPDDRYSSAPRGGHGPLLNDAFRYCHWRELSVELWNPPDYRKGGASLASALEPLEKYATALRDPEKERRFTKSILEREDQGRLGRLG